MLHVFLSWNRTCLATNQVVETFCCKTGLNAGGKTRNIALTTRFAAMLQDKSVARFYCPFHRTPVAFVDDEYWLSINPGGEVTPPKYLYGYVPPKG